MSLVFNTAATEILAADLDLRDDTIKVMLVSGQSIWNPVREDDDLLDGSPNAAKNAELAVGGYVQGYQGAGRKTLASKTFTVDDTDDEAVFDAADLTWTALLTGSTISGCAIIKEDHEASGSDANSLLICYLELSSGVPTNGSDFSLSFATEGIINLNT